MNSIEALNGISNEIKFNEDIAQENANFIYHNLHIIEKDLKAFEIMKLKNIDKDRLFAFEKVEDYNFTKDNKDKLTQDQFDLLKECLK